MKRLQNLTKAFLCTPLLALASVLIVQSTAAIATRHCDSSAQSPHLERLDRVERRLTSAVVIRANLGTMTLDDRMQFYRVPAVSIAIVDSFRIVAACGYGVRAIDDTEHASSQVTPATRFQAASISKSIAALATLELVQEERLALDTDINHWLRTWKLRATSSLDSSPSRCGRS